MTLDDIANIVEILGILALLSASLFGLAQFRQHRRDQRNLAIFELAKSFEDREFTEGYLMISSLDDDISSEALRAVSADCESAALRIGMKYETVGLLVYKGVVPLDALEDLVGDAALTLWRKLNKWVYEMRVERGHPRALEWFEWLVLQLQQRPAAEREIAAQAFPEAL